MQMARRRAVFGSGLRAGARAVLASLRALVHLVSALLRVSVHLVWASLRALVSVPPVSASVVVLAWARAVSALSPALASEETASRVR
jgi:hypothetical protein